MTASQLTAHDCFYSQVLPVTQKGDNYYGVFYDMAISPSGDMLLADYLYDAIVEVPAGGGEVFPDVPVPSALVVDGLRLNFPAAFALDHTGTNLYVLDAANSRVLKIDRSQQAALSFTSAPVGTVSPDGVKAIVVKNDGTSTLTFSSIVFPADFPEQVGGTNACSTATPLAPGARCNLNVTFKPLTSGMLTEAVVITDNTLNHSGSTHSFNMRGTGVADSLEFSSTSLSFGSEPVGYFTATQTVTVTNHGSAITFASVALGIANAGSFASSNTCGTTLAANATCTIGIRFAPTATGGATAALTLTDNSAESPQSIALNDTGINAPASSLTFSPSSLTFGGEPVGSSTASQNVTVTNTSSATAYFKSISPAGANAASFVTSNTCGASLAAGATCRIGVRFAPTVAGANAASIVLISNASSSPQSIALSGTGVSLSFSSSSIDFGVFPVGYEHGAIGVSVKNGSAAAATLNSIAETGTGASYFLSSNTCGSTLASGESCNISVGSYPEAPGAFTAAITVTYNGSSSQVIALSGTGTITLTLSPASLAFGSEPVGSSTATQAVYPGSVGTITITSITLAGPDASTFVTSNTCVPKSATGACAVGVRFVPTKTGPATAYLRFVDNATNPMSPQTVPLSGTGILALEASVNLSASSLTFGNETVGVSTATQNVIVTNTGSTILYFKSIALAGTNATSFVTSNNCGASIAAGATCLIGVRFVPVATGPASAAITLTDNADTVTQTISLSGTGQ